LNLTQLYKKFRPNQKPAEALGKDRDWNVDLIPKFIMAGGELTKILTETAVLPYLEFTQISGSYVYRDGRIAKVPATQMEAIKSSLMGIFEKRRARNFFEFVGNFKKDDVSTHQGLNLERNTMTEVYLKFGLEPGTRDFIGHAMALWTTDDYLQKPALETIERIIMYLHSVARYGKSPYIYPLYGLGELPQAFARMSAVHGGTYMLNKPVDGLVYGDDGKVIGVKSGDEVAKAPIVIGDPTYFPEKVRKTGQRVIRAMCILNHPVPNTDNLDSLQLIIPQNQLKRKHDIYVAILSSSHFVCAKGHYIAIISTVIETDQPHVEIEPAFKLLGPREDTLMGIAELYEPISDGTSDNVYISKSYDATSHFETTTDDVEDLYFRITGKKLELKKEEE
jgi:Rab GDP dissociation inhibitor